MNNYLIESDNTYSINKIIEDIIAKNKFNDATKSVYSLDDVSLDKPLEDLDTYSFLSEKKIIIIYNIDILNKDDQVEQKNHLLKYLDNSNSDNLLIIIGKKFDNKLKFIKELKSKTKYIEPVYSSEELIKEELKDYKIAISTINYLIDICENDQIKIQNECNKLRLYKVDNKEIEKEDIDLIVTRKFSDPGNLIFDFTRSLAENNKKEALRIYKELLNYGKHPLEIFSLITNQYRTLLRIKIMEFNKINNNEIAKILNKKAYYIEKQKELTKLYSQDHLFDLIHRLQDIDMKMKTTDQDYNMLIEMFIINM